MTGSINILYDIIQGVLIESWNIFLEAAPYLIFGFGIAGLLHVLVPDEMVMKYLGNSAGRIRSVINASLLGVPLPLCSCGVIPAAISLKQQGANRGATLSFLISTPQTGVDSIAITYALLDPIMTFFRPLASLTTAIAAGIAGNILDDDGTSQDVSGQLTMLKKASDSCGCDSCAYSRNGYTSFTGRLMAGMIYAYVQLLGDISKWLLVGIFLAGVISYAIPQTLISSYLGGGIGSMVIMLFVGIPLYICATGSTPLAAALVAKGMSPGTAFVFLLAGPATNMATIAVVGKFLGKKFTAIYLAVIAIFTLLFGLLLDYVY
ncbi:MAG: SO_0444 family Cu/Zn efflux transporter, partial [Euryarchaeota archaeon]|nr:SO_0444 family Cu/Zn efflux transporter [Euryarchaeota archaeon]